ncbi:MAG: hypothetical protein AB8E82_17205 [Aureispira sp.]
MKEFFAQLRWQFILLHRNNLINISVGVTLIYAFIFYLFRDTPYTKEILTLLLFSDPTLIGLLFFGLMIILERNQQVLPAFMVTPMNRHVYLCTRVLSLSIIGWACATGMALSALGLDFNVLQFSVGVFFITLLFSLAGIILIAYATEFLNYVLASVPVLVVLSAPLLPYFDLSQAPWLLWSPTQGATDLMVSTYDNSVTLNLWWAYGSTIVWLLVFYGLGYWRFYEKMAARA